MMSGQKKSILVIAAHPDDELLGAGATFAKRVRQGFDVHAVVVCEGESVRYLSENRNVGLISHAQKAAEIIGFKSFQCLMLPEQRLDTVSQIDINKRLEELLDAVRPSVIYTHFAGDINRDHQIIHDCVMVAARPFRHVIGEIYAFEIPSATGLWTQGCFNPDTFEVVDDTLEIKLQAMACYETEAPRFPHPRSIESLRHRAHYWGSIINQKAVEPFITLRRICR